MSLNLKNKEFFLDTTDIVVKQQDDDSNVLRIEGYANCTTKDRSGDIIIEDAWKGTAMHDYLKNPIILAFHDHSQPIGVMTDYYVDAMGLKIVAEISKAAGNIYNLIQDGILKAFSVGFRIKDADYDSATDIFIIKDVLLHEISVVSVPCNQDSIFAVSKSFDTEDEYLEFKKQFQSGDTGVVNTTKVDKEKDSASTTKDKTNESLEEIYNMDPKDLQDSIAETVAKALAAQKAQETAAQTAEKAAAEKATAAEARIAELAKSGAEQLVSKLREEMVESQVNFAKTVEELQASVAEKAEELARLEKSTHSKMSYGDREQNASISQKEIEEAILVSKLTNKPLAETKAGKAMLEKAANASSSASVSSDTYYETVVSTNLERDMQELLVLQPLFREVIMTSANMILPINPNATSANWVAAAQVNGAGRNATTSGAELTKALTEISLKTYKLAGKSYITDETDEDAIMPLLPLIREGLVEAHALAIDNTFLNGTASTDSPTGLIARATGAKAVTTTATFSSTDANKVTAKMVLQGRRAMGQWGLNVRDLNLVVSLEAYWDLLEDDNFSNLNEVGAQATKLTGQVGTVYGLPVIVSTQFPTPALSAPYAVLVNTKNYLVPRLRGFTVQSDYQTEEQRRVLVATQRLGLNDIISGEGVAILKYAAV